MANQLDEYGIVRDNLNQSVIFKSCLKKKIQRS